MNPARTDRTSLLFMPECSSRTHWSRDIHWAKCNSLLCSQLPNASPKQLLLKDWLTSQTDRRTAPAAPWAHTNPLSCGKTRPLWISTAHPTRSCSSQISMTLTSQESCKQLVMLVIVRAACSEIKCHGAICVWICHDFQRQNHFRHAVSSKATCNPKWWTPPRLDITAHRLILLLHVCGWWAAAPNTQLIPPHNLPSMCIAPEFLWNFLWNFLQFHTAASTGPDCGMPVAASVMKAKPGALCNLQSPRRKNKCMHNPPASVSR